MKSKKEKENTMRLEELIKKNRAILAQRIKEEELKKRKEESKKEEVVQLVAEPKEEQSVEQSEQEEKPAPKKRGRKPANREYMVVEDVEKVNE